MFDISQTEGEPLPELETEAYGETDGLVDALLSASEELGVDARIVDPADWEHGDARGVCKRRSPSTTNPVVEAVDRENRADLASTLIHEFAHAELHFRCEEEPERASREVEAEAVAYIVSRHFGLDADNAAFYLAAWDGEAAETVRDRLDRISQTASDLITHIEA